MGIAVNYLVFCFFLFLAHPSRAQSDDVKGIEDKLATARNELGVAEATLKRIADKKDNRSIHLRTRLEENIRLRKEGIRADELKLERLLAQATQTFRPRAPSPIKLGEMVVSSTGHVGRVTKIEGERVTAVKFNGVEFTTPSAIPFKGSNVITAAGRVGIVESTNLSKLSAHIRYLDTGEIVDLPLSNLSTEVRKFEDGFVPGRVVKGRVISGRNMGQEATGVVKQVFQDGRMIIKEPGEELVGSVLRKSFARILGVLGPIGLLDFLRSELEGRPAWAAGYGDQYRIREYFPSLFELSDAEIRDLLNRNGELSKDYDEFLARLKKHLGGEPRDVKCGEQISFRTDPSGGGGSNRTINIGLRPTGGISSATISEKVFDFSNVVSYEYDNYNNITRVKPKIDSLRGSMAADINRPMDLASFQSSASKIPSMGIGSLISRAAFFDVYLTLIQPDLEKACPHVSFGNQAQETLSRSATRTETTSNAAGGAR